MFRGSSHSLFYSASWCYYVEGIRVHNVPQLISANGWMEREMQQSSDTPAGRQIDAGAARPPNYLVRAITLTLILVPLALLVGLSSLAAFFSYVSGPPFRSEIPSWFRALMELLRVFVAAMGLFMPVLALVKALKVNSRFDAGDYGGAATASREAAGYCRQSIIFVIIIILIMAVDLLRFFGSQGRGG